MPGFPSKKVSAPDALAAGQPRKNDLVADALRNFYSTDPKVKELVTILERHVRSTDPRVSLQAMQLLFDRIWGRPVTRELVAGKVDHAHTVKGLSIRFVNPSDPAVIVAQAVDRPGSKLEVDVEAEVEAEAEAEAEPTADEPVVEPESVIVEPVKKRRHRDGRPDGVDDIGPDRRVLTDLPQDTMLDSTVVTKVMLEGMEKCAPWRLSYCDGATLIDGTVVEVLR